MESFLELSRRQNRKRIETLKRTASSPKYVQTLAPQVCNGIMKKHGKSRKKFEVIAADKFCIHLLYF